LECVFTPCHKYPILGGPKCGFWGCGEAWGRVGMHPGALPPSPPSPPTPGWGAPGGGGVRTGVPRPDPPLPGVPPRPDPPREGCTPSGRWPPRAAARGDTLPDGGTPSPGGSTPLPPGLTHPPWGGPTPGRQPAWGAYHSGSTAGCVHTVLLVHDHVTGIHVTCVTCHVCV